MLHQQMAALDLLWSTTGNRFSWLLWTIPLALLRVHIEIIVLTYVQRKLDFNMASKF